MFKDIDALSEVISIIICVSSRSVGGMIDSNIRETIGADYELVVIDNSNSAYNIFTAYSEGTKKAKGNILVFIHEDVTFRSESWGKILEQNFLDESVGVIGVAGTHFLPKHPCAWWDSGISSMHYLQGTNTGGEYITRYNNEDVFKRSSNEMASLDGFFLAFPKRIFDIIQWDTSLFDGFHGYDTDICLQVLHSGHKVCMNWDILLEHKSLGNVTSSAFQDSQGAVFRKWEGFLPVERGIVLSDTEKSLCSELAVNQYYIRSLQIKMGSLEYKLGRAILHPFSFLKRKFDRIIDFFDKR